MFLDSTVQHAVLQSVGNRVKRALVRSQAVLIAALLFAGASAVVAPAVFAPTAFAQGGGRLSNDSSGKGVRKQPTLEERRRMVAEFEQFIEKRLFDRLKATDEQRVKLRALKKRLDVDKNQLFKDEGDFRRAMRVELTAATPSDAKLSELLDKWPALQRRRIDIQEREQKELAKFLTPVQRAGFFAFDDELRRARQDTQWGRGDRGPGAPGMPGMRGDSIGGRGSGGFRGGGGGRGGKPPVRVDTSKSIR